VRQVFIRGGIQSILENNRDGSLAVPHISVSMFTDTSYVAICDVQTSINLKACLLEPLNTNGNYAAAQESVLYLLDHYSVR